jgi:ElaB/YqjD/DUF883 family membrane-anchored ribosome-binding protein
MNARAAEAGVAPGIEVEHSLRDIVESMESCAAELGRISEDMYAIAASARQRIGAAPNPRYIEADARKMRELLARVNRLSARVNSAAATSSALAQSNADAVFARLKDLTAQASERAERANAELVATADFVLKRFGELRELIVDGAAESAGDLVRIANDMRVQVGVLAERSKDLRLRAEDAVQSIRELIER